MAHPDHHHGHRHLPPGDADRRPLIAALALIVGFMFVEVVAGVVAGSLALLSDAAHMLTDAAAIALALVAARLAGRPPAGAFTFGLRRAEILSAQVNGAALLALAVVIGFDAVRRLAGPVDVQAGIVIVVGALGVAVNLGAAWSLGRGQRRSLNVEGARMHVLADLFGSVGAVVAGCVVVATGFDRADPIAALLVAGLMLRSAWGLLRDSGRVLLEAAPAGMVVQDIGDALARHPAVREVHDLHVWEVTSGFPALAAHVMVPSGADCHQARRELQELLRARFAITHTTLQVDHEPGPQLVDIEPAPRA